MASTGKNCIVVKFIPFIFSFMNKLKSELTDWENDFINKRVESKNNLLLRSHFEPF